MNIKITYFILLFSASTIFSQIEGYDKLRPALVVMKSGDTLNNILGQLKSKHLKYKKYYSGKSIKISFNEIDRVEFKLSKTHTRIFHILPIQGKNKLIAVQRFVTGNKVNLYGIVGRYGNSILYYIQEISENQITELGSYSPPFGKIKDKLKILFSDCDLLLSKIENREFKVRSDIIQMFIFYNDECK